MNIELLTLTEQEDGSAICELELDNEAKVYLINLGFIELIKQGIEIEKADK